MNLPMLKTFHRGFNEMPQELRQSLKSRDFFYHLAFNFDGQSNIFPMLILCLPFTHNNTHYTFTIQRVCNLGLWPVLQQEKVSQFLRSMNHPPQASGVYV